MKPLIILILAFLISIIVIKFSTGCYNFGLAGRIGMAVMLLVTGMAHFIYTKGMAMMLPSFIPYKTFVVYLTGIIEIAAAVGLLVPTLFVTTAWLLILFLILILPANIYAGVKHINYQKGTSDGDGLKYLWFRVPLQILFIMWVYYFAIMY